MITIPFGVVERPAIFEETNQLVVGQRFGSHQFGQTAFTGPSPDLHLPQTVLCNDEALGEKQIVQILRENVRHAPFVAKHLHFGFQSIKPKIAVDLRQRFLGELLKGNARCRRGRLPAAGGKDERCDAR